jgi:hypothetical protein
MFWPCQTRTSTCGNFATISSGLYRFLAITVLLGVKRHTSSRTASMGADHHALAGRILVAAAGIAAYDLGQNIVGQLVAACEVMQGAVARPYWDIEPPDIRYTYAT